MELNVVPAGKSLTGIVRCVRVGKIISSPGCGATSPTQLAAVVQRVSVDGPPTSGPSQVATAGTARSSRAVKRNFDTGMSWGRKQVGARTVGRTPLRRGR